MLEWSPAPSWQECASVRRGSAADFDFESGAGLLSLAACRRLLAEDSCGKLQMFVPMAPDGECNCGTPKPDWLPCPHHVLIPGLTGFHLGLGLCMQNHADT